MFANSTLARRALERRNGGKCCSSHSNVNVDEGETGGEEPKTGGDPAPLPNTLTDFTATNDILPHYFHLSLQL